MAAVGVMRQETPSRLGQMLSEWAEWRREASAAGYPTSDSLWRMRMAKGGEATQEPVRLGVLRANPEVRRVEDAVRALLKDHHRLMGVTLTYYQSGPMPMIGAGYTMSELMASLEEAHRLIADEMQLRG